MSFAFSVFCGSVVAVYLGNVFAKPTSCWAGKPLPLMTGLVKAISFARTESPCEDGTQYS